jgi:LuxR family maltose regulon positive regulatory protein
LHRLASAWHEGNGFPEKAIDHALAAQDWEKAINLVMSMNPNPLVAYPGATVYDWLRQVPREVLMAHPIAYVIFVWALITIGQVKAGADLLDSFEKSAVYDDDTAALVAGARISIATYLGDPRIEEYAKKVRSLRPDDILARMITGIYLGMYYMGTRRFNEAEPFLSEAYAYFQQKGFTGLASGAQNGLVLITFSRGKLHRAEQMLKQALGTTGWNDNTASFHLLLSVVYHCWNDLEGAANEREKANLSYPAPSIMASIHLYNAAACLRKGDIDTAAGAIEKAERMLITKDATPESIARITAFHLTLALEEDDREAVSRWLDKLAEYEGPFLYDVPASTRHLLYEKWGNAGREQLQAEYEQYHKEGYQYLEMEVRLEQALLSPDPEEAVSFLADVLVMARPEGNIRILVDFGMPIMPLLRRAIGAGIEPDFARKVLKVIEEEERQRKIRKGEIPSSAGLLSEREMEVLPLLADGLTNHQIAERLIISLSTAKSHVYHIFSKLEAGDRLQAVNRARELKLI